MTLVLLLAASGTLAALAPAVARPLGGRAGWFVGAALASLTAALFALRPAEGALTAAVEWIPTADISLRLQLDGLSFLFAMVVLGVGAVVMLYSAAYVKDRAPGFYLLMAFFAFAMLALVLADDIVVLFVAWELTTLCSYLLILRSSPDAAAPAGRTLLVTAGGGLALLGAVTALVVRTGTTELTAVLNDQVWQDDPVFAGVVAALVALAAMTKSAQFPFHAWLPDAMVAPAPVSAYLHAAAMVKAGIYLLMRFSEAASATWVWPVVLVTIGLVTAIMGAVFALQRTDLKELFAYSTVSQLGLLVAVIGVGTPEALTAASLHVVAHALFKSSGFMYVGLVEKRAGTRDIRELQGLARAMPWTSAMAVLGVAGMAGLPPLLGFASKELVLDAMAHSPAGAAVGLVIALAATAASVGTVAYSARVVVRTLPGRPMELKPARGTVSMAVAVGVTAVAGAVGGLLVGFLDPVVLPAAANATGTAVGDLYPLSLWHGVNLALLLSAVAVGGGAVAVWQRSRVDSALDRPLFPFTGVAAVTRTQTATIAGGRRVGDLTRTDLPAAHLAVPLTVIAGGGLLAAGLTVGSWSADGGAAVADIGLTLLIVVGVAAAIASRTRLGAVIAAGIVGFTVALWYYSLGAADVALTQLLVEILTVVVMVLVLRRLPATFRRRSARGRLTGGVVAVAAGCVATVGTLALTGGRPLSSAGEFFLDLAEEETGGTNVVNTILVDFRALDTLGELVVLGIAALAMTALLTARSPVGGEVAAPLPGPLSDPALNTVFLRSLARPLVPLMVLGSLYALWRGHNAPGGGLIAALLGASALALLYLAAVSDRAAPLRLPYLSITGTGILVAVGSGVLGLADGSFLRPLHADLLGVHLTTALVFDLGVYLAVFGVILAAINLLGMPPLDDGPRGRARAGSHPPPRPTAGASAAASVRADHDSRATEEAQR
ncbi:DUF4040 family protein [Streptomyces spiramenti]|uniref:DUF4040 family protein n=1 Tax=Streptomyces spiramenti TaxID=2720606 RepID=A0ABX1AGU9_9ACTN|nr:DUF4040 family protein [Streptomyces spiramenti]NJP64856.1 DUF4040 family protein [Streptomyces spiramenti]